MGSEEPGLRGAQRPRRTGGRRNTSRKINRMVPDCDIRAFFDTVSRNWLVPFLEHRIGDKPAI